jgi:hypothetical protein
MVYLPDFDQKGELSEGSGSPIRWGQPTMYPKQERDIEDTWQSESLRDRDNLPEPNLQLTTPVATPPPILHLATNVATSPSYHSTTTAAAPPPSPILHLITTVATPPPHKQFCIEPSPSQHHHHHQLCIDHLRRNTTATITRLAFDHRRRNITKPGKLRVSPYPLLSSLIEILNIRSPLPPSLIKKVHKRQSQQRSCFVHCLFDSDVILVLPQVNS